MEVDTQEHLFECQQIRELLPCNINNQRIDYENIFSNNCDILLEVAQLLKRIVKIREDLMDTGTIWIRNIDARKDHALPSPSSLDVKPSVILVISISPISIQRQPELNSEDGKEIINC